MLEYVMLGLCALGLCCYLVYSLIAAERL